MEAPILCARVHSTSTSPLTIVLYHVKRRKASMSKSTEPKQGEKRSPVIGSTLKKRAPQKSTAASNTFFYINRNTSLHALLKKVRKQLILNGEKKITLCGLGAAVSKTSLLALQIQDMITPPTTNHNTQDSAPNSMGSTSFAGLEKPRKQVELCVRTGTVEMMDEIVPDDPDEDIRPQIRRNSKIEIDLVVVTRRG